MLKNVQAAVNNMFRSQLSGTLRTAGARDRSPPAKGKESQSTLQKAIDRQKLKDKK